MTNKIILKKSSVTGKVPLVTDLDYGEVALNYQDGKLYYKKADNIVDTLTYVHPNSGVTAGTYPKVTVNAQGHVTSGTTLVSSDIPSLDMSKITTGVLLTDRIVEPNYTIATTPSVNRPAFDVLRADRTAFLPIGQIIVESSTDAGVTWIDAGLSEATKLRLFTGQRPSIPIPLKNGVKSTDCMVRVTITGMRYNVPAGTAETDKYSYWNSTNVLSTERYFAATNGWVWLASNSDRIHFKAERATGAASNTWVLDREAFMAGWSGGNFFTLSGSTFGGSTGQTANTWNWRFTFRTCSPTNTFNDADLATTYTNSIQVINHIKIIGQNVYSSSNNLMYNDHLYSWNENQDMLLPAGLSVTGAISSSKPITNTNDISADGSNIIINTITKTSTLYAIDIRRSNNTVAGITLDGKLAHTGLNATDGTNVDQIKTITKSLTMTTDWQDTGIKSTDLATGTYMVQLVANDTGSGGTNNNEYYSGTMSWYSGDTDSAMELPTDEITLHRAGGSGDGALYLRTYRTATANPDNLKLQIYSNTANASAANYVFKFRRII